jgi:hypothetical protein
MKIFALILARDKNNIEAKIREMKSLELPFKIICGEKVDNPHIIYRPPKGKFDAINYGRKFIPPETEIVLMNDVDAEIHNLSPAINYFNNPQVGLVFARVDVGTGPQLSFYKILDRIRRIIPITASGELIIIKKELLDEILPIKPCKAEDSLIMFKVLEKKQLVVFCEDTFVKTIRTQTPEQEEKYKRRTVGGLYQALAQSKPPAIIRTFYILLPLASPVLLVLGKKGYFWMRGILYGFIDYLRGDITGSWKETY